MRDIKYLVSWDLSINHIVHQSSMASINLLASYISYLGNGWTLLFLTLGLMLIGIWIKDRHLALTGRLALITWAAAGLTSLTLKHLIGRPRPRLALHGELSLLGPSWVSGFDSMPSGHTISSFAVATVLASFYPRLSWLFYTLAFLVGLSRIFCGSHFLSDVVAGAI
ncbi:MAG: phosphatase PAP2 family protein, partial [bacterium]|nr:phosphatase PAP2 family protein [bacterium]